MKGTGESISSSFGTYDAEVEHDTRTISLPIVIATGGFSLTFSQLFLDLVYTTQVFANAAHLAIIIAGICIAYFVVSLFAEFVQRHRLATSIVICLIGLVAVATYCLASYVDGFDLGIISSFCYGFAGAALAALWLETICSTCRKNLRFVIALSIALAVLLDLLLLLVQQAFVFWLSSCFFALSFIVYLVEILQALPRNTLVFAASKDSAARCQIKINSVVLTVINSIAAGFFLCALRLDTSQTAINFFVGGVTAVIFFALAIDSTRSARINESSIRYIILPITAVFLLLLLITSETAWPWLAAGGFCFLLFPYASALFATCEHVTRDNLSFFRVGGATRAFAIGGLLLGFLWGHFTFGETLEPSRIVDSSIILLVMVLIVGTVVFDQKDLYPVQNGSQKIDAPDPDSEESLSENKKWQEKCNFVAEERQLTSREKEVMLLLAKGYSHELIADHLCISKNTVKCHIYNIYNKVDAHSKTDLIRLIETTEVE